ncbi:MAG: hypothetical protein WDZ48_08130 [Pirellulales bacterium]
MISRRVLLILVTVAVVFPLVIVVVLAAARLLDAMQDTAAATVLDRIVLAVAILWALDLVCLLLAIGINALGSGPGSGES